MVSFRRITCGAHPKPSLFAALAAPRPAPAAV